MARVSRVCGLDPGEVRVGVAVSDELGFLAHGRGAWPRKPEPDFFRRLVELCKDEDVTRFVVGFPLDMKGGEGGAAEKVRTFAERLSDATGLDVELWDERMTSVQANRTLRESTRRDRREKGRVDELAAVLILQSWLDARGGA